VSGAFDGIRYLKSMLGTFRKRTRVAMFVIGKIFKCPKDLSVRAHVTKTMKAYMWERERREGEKERKRKLREKGERERTEESSLNEWSNIYSGLRHLTPFTVAWTIPNSNTNGFYPTVELGKFRFPLSLIKREEI